MMVLVGLAGIVAGGVSLRWRSESYRVRAADYRFIELTSILDANNSTRQAAILRRHVAEMAPADSASVQGLAVDAEREASLRRDVARWAAKWRTSTGGPRVAPGPPLRSSGRSPESVRLGV